MLQDIKPRCQPCLIKDNLLYRSYRFFKSHKISIQNPFFIVSTKDIATHLNCSLTSSLRIIHRWFKKGWCTSITKIKGGWLIVVPMAYNEHFTSYNKDPDHDLKDSTKDTTREPVDKSKSVDNLNGKRIYSRNFYRKSFCRAKNARDAKRHWLSLPKHQQIEPSILQDLLNQILNGKAKFFSRLGKILSGIKFFSYTKTQGQWKRLNSIIQTAIGGHKEDLKTYKQLREENERAASAEVLNGQFNGPNRDIYFERMKSWEVHYDELKT